MSDVDGLATAEDHATGLQSLTHPSVRGPSQAGVVHDLGNLIQVALSGLNRVARDPAISSAPGLESVIASARTALHSAGALVRETIGESCGSRRHDAATDLGPCLIELEALVGSTLEPEVSVRVRFDPDLPPAGCDQLGLQNAVLNLVFNAREAMPDGGLISIDAAAVDEGDGVVIELRVEDTGIGMKPETIVHAFDPFFTTKGPGLGGVGLPMVKRFAEETGGSVGIESTFGAGTIVILRLPAIGAGG
jgi:signal transduction histidine kinase